MPATETPHGSLDRTLGALVSERPARARVLERLGLDYCCHGQRTLLAAARDAGLAPEEVAVAIDAVDDDAGAEIDRLDPVSLVDHLLATHHAYLHEELPLLVALAEKVRDVHGSRHPELVRVAELVSEIRADLEPHLAKEETVLFPAIRGWAEGQRRFPFGELANPVQVLLAEHDRAGELLEALRTTTQGYVAPEDGCASYRSLYQRLERLEADTHRHVHLENNVLFPAVAGESQAGRLPV